MHPSPRRNGPGSGRGVVPLVRAATALRLQRAHAHPPLAGYQAFIWPMALAHPDHPPLAPGTTIRLASTGTDITGLW